MDAQNKFQRENNFREYQMQPCCANCRLHKHNNRNGETTCKFDETLLISIAWECDDIQAYFHVCDLWEGIGKE